MSSGSSIILQNVRNVSKNNNFEILYASYFPEPVYQPKAVESFKIQFPQAEISQLLINSGKYEYGGSSRDGFIVFGNNKDHGDRLKDMGAVEIYTNVLIPLNNFLITSGYYFINKGKNQEFEDFIRSGNKKMIIQYYKGGNFSIFGNTFLYKEKLKEYGGSYKNYLIISGPNVIRSKVYFFIPKILKLNKQKENCILDYIDKSNKQIRSVDSDLLGKIINRGEIMTMNTIIPPIGERNLILVENYDDDHFAVFNLSYKHISYYGDLLETEGLYTDNLDYTGISCNSEKRKGYLYENKKISFIKPLVDAANGLLS